MGDYKLIWGSRTVKNIWFPAKEEVLNAALCDHVKKTRTQANRTLSSNAPRGMESMDVLNLNVDEEYEDEYDNLARMQEIDLEEQEYYNQTELDEDLGEDLDNVQSVMSLFESEKSTRMARTTRKGRGKNNMKGGGKKKGDKKKKGGSGKNKKNIPLPNNSGVIKKPGDKRCCSTCKKTPRRGLTSAETIQIYWKS